MTKGGFGWSGNGNSYRLCVGKIERWNPKKEIWVEANIKEAVIDAHASGVKKCINIVSSEPLLPEEHPEEFGQYAELIFSDSTLYKAFRDMLLGSARDTKNNLLNKIRSL